MNALYRILQETSADPASRGVHPSEPRGLSPRQALNNPMTPEDLKLLVKGQPFTPFRMTMATNETFDVWHPELLIVGRSIAALGLTSAAEESIADNIIWLDLNQIVHFQPIASVSSN